MIGKGRTWVMDCTHQIRRGPCLVACIFESQKERAAQMRDILSFHEIEIEVVDSIQRLAQAYLRAPDEVKVVYLCEMAVGSAAIPGTRPLDGCRKQTPD